MSIVAPILVRVAARTREAEDIVSFELEASDGASLPPFSAGAHIDVEVRPGLVRQYSLCNDPSEAQRYLIAVMRDPHSRGGSAGMHDGVEAGATLRISAPRNHFPLAPAANILLFAGGIGITPILCMAERLAQTRADFTLHYSCRSPGRAAFRERIAASGFAGRVRFHFDTEGEAQRLDLDAVLSRVRGDTHLYVCGPPGYIEAVTGAARRQGWPDDRIHLEYFGAAPRDAAGDRPFDIRIASTGKVYTVPADRPVIRVLEEHGIEVQVSCEQGVCGTCITRVLEGTPDHRDQYFTDEERERNDQFTPCCSRAKSGVLVLDL
jgi:vanillate O-demethylase ferredoxin subunit